MIYCSKTDLCGKKTKEDAGDKGYPKFSPLFKSIKLIHISSALEN